MQSTHQALEKLSHFERFMEKLWLDLEPKNTLNTTYFVSSDFHKKLRYITFFVNTITFIWTMFITGNEFIPNHFALLQFLTIWAFIICYGYSILVIVWENVPDDSLKWRFTYVLGEIGFALQLMICPFFFTVMLPYMMVVMKFGFWEMAFNILLHAIVPIFVWLETFFTGISFPKSHRIILNWIIVAYLINNLAWTLARKRPVYPPVDWISLTSYVMKTAATLAVIGGFILGGVIYEWKKEKYLHPSNNILKKVK